MDKIAVDLRKHFSFDGKKFSQPSGTMHYDKSVFKSDAANQDLAQLNEARVDVNNLGAPASREFVNQVVAKINEEILLKDPEKSALKPVADDATPTLPEFTDALHLAVLPEVNIDKVSKQAVCEFARGVMRASNDPWDLSLDNDFGTFLSYISLDAAIYAPNKERKIAGSKKPDEDARFARDPYWWGGYELDRAKGGQPHITCASAKKQIEATGFPLKDLYELNDEGSKRVDLSIWIKEDVCPGATSNAISTWALIDKDGQMRIKLGAERLYPGKTDAQGEALCYRAVHVATYNDKLIAGDGKCDELKGEMKVKDAIRYIDAVIKDFGLSYKPTACKASGEAVSSGGHGAGGARGGGSV
jgi:hypothetical protein